MLKSFRRFIEEFLSSDAADASVEAHEHQLKLATAAVLMEMVNADFTVQQNEREHVLDLLTQEFRLSPSEAARLVELGAEGARESVSLYEFTQTIDKAMSIEDKIRIIEMLWQVAFVDGVLDKYEEYLVRKLADLLHLSHRQMMQAKHRVMERRGLAP